MERAYKQVSKTSYRILFDCLKTNSAIGELSLYSYPDLGFINRVRVGAGLSRMNVVDDDHLFHRQHLIAALTCVTVGTQSSLSRSNSRICSAVHPCSSPSGGT